MDQTMIDFILIFVFAITIVYFFIAFLIGLFKLCRLDRKRTQTIRKIKKENRLIAKIGAKTKGKAFVSCEKCDYSGNLVVYIHCADPWPVIDSLRSIRKMAKRIGVNIVFVPDSRGF